ncbi:SRPBCC family protein [Streptomyces sp. PTM05]|uniref:SRPBCC family protein n=1 Tax=Streptantibioticus parmotrematis TaxID=2873249 RepID=A0ABS7QX92_9ACTN|nr:SRPBCC family protein [Streptantibioticus parmotrematis]MBY8886980.1 SRPBCC family protein [Streptantibioticus parmotrematis]
MAAIEVRRLTSGDPERVYELIADITRMNEWSPESAGGVWLSGIPGAVGSTFRGDNRRGIIKWSTLCVVTAAEHGRRFAFAVTARGRRVATWEFELRPAGGGCEIIERTVDQRGPLYKLSSVLTTGLRRRSNRNRETMVRTLERLAQEAEV